MNAKEPTSCPQSLGWLMLTGTMTAAEPNVTLYQLQKNCERLAAETFNRETAR